VIAFHLVIAVCVSLSTLNNPKLHKGQSWRKAACGGVGLIQGDDCDV
jgi:hypothetical protein